MSEHDASEHTSERRSMERSSPRRAVPPGEGDLSWVQAQITEIWRALNSLTPGHTDEQLRRIVREEVDAAVAGAIPEFTLLRNLGPDLAQMVTDHKRHRQEELASAALWADWRARIDAAVKAVPQLFGLLGVLLTVAQLNRQGIVPNAAYWLVVAGVVIYGVWVLYGNLLRPLRTLPPSPSPSPPVDHKEETPHDHPG